MEARIEINSLPDLETITITSAHIEKFASLMHGGAGLRGTNSELWRIKFPFCAHNLSLEENTAIITKFANENVPLDQTRALMSG